MEHLTAADAPAARSAYSLGLGDLLFTAGTSPLNRAPGDVVGRTVAEKTSALRFRTVTPPLSPKRSIADLWVGVRREALHVMTAPDGACRVSDVADVIETFGRETLLHCSVGGEVIVAQVGPELEMEIGQDMAFTVEPGDFQIFECTGCEAAAA